MAEDIDTLQKVSRLKDGDIRITVVHVLFQAAGTFGRHYVPNKMSYLIDIDCYTENKTREISNVLTRCDNFKQHIWNIFQWSITDELRTAMGEPRPSEN